MANYLWELDLAHSDIDFKISHLLVSHISGIFRLFSGTIKTSETYNFTNAVFEIAIDVFSIETNTSERDEELKSADFFDADNYPQITFTSNSFNHIEGDKYELSGTLFVRGISKYVTLNVLFGGNAKDGFGLNRATFEIEGIINRNDFNLHNKDVDEANSFILGEEIKLEAKLQFVNKPEETNNDY